MQINIKLKIDPNRNRLNLWNKNKNPFFFENSKPKQKINEIEHLELSSLRDFTESLDFTQQEPMRSYREHSRDTQIKQKKRIMSSSKRSHNKTIKDVLGITQIKSFQAKKSNSDVPKVPLKKFSLKSNNIVTD